MAETFTSTFLNNFLLIFVAIDPFALIPIFAGITHGLKKNEIKPRPGVLDIISYCKRNKIKIGFATSTTKNNIDSVFLSTVKYLKKKDFNYIGNTTGNKNTKTKLEVYKHCLKKLKLKNEECIAIEDTEISLKSAVKAKIKCIAFPGDFHTDSKFKNSLIRVRKLKTDLIFS